LAFGVLVQDVSNCEAGQSMHCQQQQQPQQQQDGEDYSSLLVLPASTQASRPGRHRLADIKSGTSQQGNSVKVYVMMSLTMVSLNGTLNDPEALRRNLTKIRETGATGVMSDVWWGITEPEPQKYNFAAYRQFFSICREVGLEVQIVTSFHQCCDEGSDCYIPVPAFVRKEPGIWYKNALGDETRAYISLFADDVKVGDRTPRQMYEDWVQAFQLEFQSDIGTLIVEVMLGMGTDGELKYPSYENPAGKWQYPGIGMFQAFDQHALESLKAAASTAGEEAWGLPPSAEVTGYYNSFPNETTFFRDDGGYQTSHGKFFLNWYSQALIHHGANMLTMARKTLGSKVRISGKIAGVHWWYKTKSHAAELTAGFYNTNGVNAYANIATAFAAASNAIVDFTCLEMTDASQNPAYECGPQELVQQVMRAAGHAGVPFSGENALGFYDAPGYEQMVSYKPPTGDLESVTYLRISDEFLQLDNLNLFSKFVAQMKEDSFATPFSLDVI